MNSVGIFTTTRSLQHIMDIDQEIRTFCNVTYLPYTTLEHLLYLYFPVWKRSPIPTSISLTETTIS